MDAIKTPDQNFSNMKDRRLDEDALERLVTERTLALQKANTLLRQRNAELEQYAYATSHDLQEPLRKIRVFVDMLLQQEESTVYDMDRTQVLGRIRGSADRMAQLIEGLLSYGRLGHDGHPFVATELSAVVLGVLKDFDLRIAETGARVQVLTLPVIEAVPLQMTQLFYNLLGNALKFHHPGTAPFVRISAEPLTPEALAAYPGLEPGEPYYRIVVKDNGIGFDQASVDKMFGLFQRLHTKERFPGTGIGLAICRKIIHHHRGEIFAFSKEGEGAEFHIVLPTRYRAPAD